MLRGWMEGFKREMRFIKCWESASVESVHFNIQGKLMCSWTYRERWASVWKPLFQSFANKIFSSLEWHATNDLFSCIFCKATTRNKIMNAHLWSFDVCSLRRMALIKNERRDNEHVATYFMPYIADYMGIEEHIYIKSWWSQSRSHIWSCDETFGCSTRSTLGAI